MIKAMKTLHYLNVRRSSSLIAKSAATARSLAGAYFHADPCTEDVIWLHYVLTMQGGPQSKSKAAGAVWETNKDKESRTTVAKETLLHD
jgi:hypothetical protein